MSNAITIRNNFPRVADKLDRLAVDVGEKALVRALNTTVKQGEGAMARQISREFRISTSEARKRLASRRATSKGSLRFRAVLLATKAAKGRGMNLIAFLEKKVTLGQAKKRAKDGTLNQLRFAIKRAGGQKMIRGAFIANKGRTVFIREGKERLPIKPITTIDVAQMFNTRRINKVIISTIYERFEKNFNRELRSVLKGYVK